MGVIKGQNLRILLGNKCVAFATSCTVHVSINLEESSTKDSTNGAAENTPTGYSWDISVDALYSVDTDATGVNGIGAIDAALAMSRVQVEFDQTGGTKNRTPVTGAVKYSGYAYVTDISISAANKQNTTYTLQATGDGELSKNS